MTRGQYDLGHYTLYFIIFLFVSLFVLGYVNQVYGEKNIDVLRTYVHLKNTFAFVGITTCFLDDAYAFDERLFTTETLQNCASRPAKVTLEDIHTGKRMVIGKEDVVADLVWREYIATSRGGGVLTIEMESF